MVHYRRDGAHIDRGIEVRITSDYDESIFIGWFRVLYEVKSPGLFSTKVYTTKSDWIELVRSKSIKHVRAIIKKELASRDAEIGVKEHPLDEQ